MKLKQHPQKDGYFSKYDCGLVCHGSWASRLEQWEHYKKTKAGKYILQLEELLPRSNSKKGGGE